MASGGTPGAKPAPNLCCSLCLEPFKGRTPKILSCFHSFCLDCLKTFEESLNVAKLKTSAEASQLADTKVNENGANEEEGKALEGQGDAVGEDQKEAVTFACPTCRASVTLPDGGVEKLQTNFYLETEDEADGLDAPSVLCQMCEVGSERAATHSCQECEQHMCPDCRRLHDKMKMTRGHQVSALPVPKNPCGAASGKAGPGKCPVHKDQDICFLCLKCDTNICLHCKLTKHEGHETVDSATADADAVANISLLIPEAKDQLSVLESCQRHLVRQGFEQTRHADDATRKINAGYDATLAALKARRDQLLEEVTARAEDANAKLLTLKTEITDDKAALTKAMEDARETKLDGRDKVGARKALQAAMVDKDLIADMKKTATDPIPIPSWHLEQKQDAQAPVVACLGRVVDEKVDLHFDTAPPKKKEGPTSSDVGLTVCGFGKDITVLNRVVILPNVIVNRGCGYDVVSGTFTAPVTGNYRISASIETGVHIVSYGCSDIERTVKIQKRGSMLAGVNLICLTKKGAGWIAHSVCTKLAAGEEVFIVPEEPYGDNSWYCYKHGTCNRGTYETTEYSCSIKLSIVLRN